MKKFLLTSLMAASLAMGSFAEVKVTVEPLGEKPVSPVRKVVSTEDILMYENFDGMTDDDSDFEYPLASYYNGYIIDPDLTGGEQWTGDRIYSADGAVALCTPDPQGHAWIATPKGDYSGSVKVTFIAKYARYDFETESGGMGHWSGSSIFLDLFTPNDDEFKLENAGDMAGYYVAEVRLYENQGWSRITVEFDNYSAYNDAALRFFTGNSVYIDNIEICSSVDNFIASPVINGLKDMTETSFTVDFQPVRKAFNYYTYLYTLEGYDESGNPQFRPVLAPEIMEEIEMYGMTLEEYLEMMPSEAYWNYGDVPQVEKQVPTTFTFYGLDPAVDYYYSVRSHFVYDFSDSEIYPARYVAAPEMKEATAITEKSFTANWQPIVKADKYEVSLWGVNEVQEDTDSFIIFEEDFENVSGYTDAEDIYTAEPIDVESGLTMDDLTSSPGWDYPIELGLLAKGMFGIDMWNYWLISPEIYVGGSDKATVSLRVELPSPDGIFYIAFAGYQYQIQADENVFEGEVELPTYGLKTTNFQITGPQMEQIFVDYISISQSLKKGDLAYTFMGSNETDSTDFSFTDLDTERFDMYGYSVKSIRGEGEAALISEASDRIIVDLKNGTSKSNITDVETVGTEDVVEVERYTIDGTRIASPAKGLNIIRMSDGSVRKVMVK